jgi:hypothetical protein
MSRLNEETVKMICQCLVRRSNDPSIEYKDIAKFCGLEGTANDVFLISTIRRRKRWNHVSDNYNW